jgi:hypothetical protein
MTGFFTRKKSAYAYNKNKINIKEICLLLLCFMLDLFTNVTFLVAAA